MRFFLFTGCAEERCIRFLTWLDSWPPPSGGRRHLSEGAFCSQPCNRGQDLHQKRGPPRKLT